MLYSFELLKHANIRYRESLSVLSRCELFAMLFSLGISCDIREESLGSSRFLSFECRTLTDDEITYLSGHSSVVFLAENRSGLLRPLTVAPCHYLPEDLPEILKYKGKTSATFTGMMINTAAALSPFIRMKKPLTFFDPLCGKGTGCFCAAVTGMNAVGLDISRKEISEAVVFFSRYLKMHKLKHAEKAGSVTYNGHPVPVTDFSYADTREHYQAKEIRRMRLACSDTADSPALFGKSRAHIIAADLPYGIQHAPQSGKQADSLPAFLHRVLPVWKRTLEPHGVIALSFNTLTLPSSDVRSALLHAGFSLPKNDIFFHLRHDVEQAVVRDVIFAFNTEEESVI